jgi:hypothetical protein
MERSILISNIILSMREFQKKNNIKNKCAANTQYLYDTIIMNSGSNVKAKAVFVVSIDDETDTTILVGGHLVVILGDETMIDPSYDIFCLKNKSYFDNIKDLIDMFDNKDKDKLKTKIDIKKLVCDHIEFMKIAERMNNGQHIITEKFYNEQADYIKKLYSKYNILF